MRVIIEDWEKVIDDRLTNESKAFYNDTYIKELIKSNEQFIKAQQAKLKKTKKQENISKIEKLIYEAYLQLNNLENVLNMS